MAEFITHETVPDCCVHESIAVVMNNPGMGEAVPILVTNHEICETSDRQISVIYEMDVANRKVFVGCEGCIYHATHAKTIELSTTTS